MTRAAAARATVRPRAPGAVSRLPGGPGVYRFLGARGGVLYIGRAASLRSRVASYWGDLGSRAHLAPMVPGIAQVQALECASGHEAAWLERNLLQERLPPWNRTAGGQEVPVWIRLDLRPESAGLSVVHEARPAAPQELRHFGPYLGGARVRLAVSGLNRVLPLAYAADGLRGLSREMASVRGVGPGDRDAMAQVVTAVLSRDPAAVAWLQAELTRRRGDAAACLAFERAARLQAEIRAVEWVTAEQRVTRDDPADHDVHGWAGGVLVSLAVRGGRLTGWRQRPCPLGDAGPLVAATPAAWQPFAQRNAELAARLRFG